MSLPLSLSLCRRCESERQTQCELLPLRVLRLRLLLLWLIATFTLRASYEKGSVYCTAVYHSGRTGCTGHSSTSRSNAVLLYSARRSRTGCCENMQTRNSEKQTLTSSFRVVGIVLISRRVLMLLLLVVLLKHQVKAFGMEVAQISADGVK